MPYLHTVFQRCPLIMIWSSLEQLSLPMVTFYYDNCPFFDDLLSSKFKTSEFSLMLLAHVLEHLSYKLTPIILDFMAIWSQHIACLL